MSSGKEVMAAGGALATVTAVMGDFAITAACPPLAVGIAVVAISAGVGYGLYKWFSK